MRFARSLSAFSVVVAACAWVDAQQTRQAPQPPAPLPPQARFVPGRYADPGFRGVPYVGPYYSGFWNPGAGSTVLGSQMQGMASAIRAQGEYNLMTAQGNVFQQEARTRSIQNRQLATQTYFEMRRMNQMYTDQERSRFASVSPSQIAAARAPRQLSAAQLDPVTGAIVWPAALQDSQFTAERDELSRLFTARAEQGAGHDPALVGQIDAAASALRGKLVAQVNNMQPQAYVNARAFLDSLVFEAHSPSV